MSNMDLSCYAAEMQELRDWLSTGAKTEHEFDAEFSQPKRPARVIAYTSGAPILGSFSQGLGPYTWAGRLELLQIMVATGEVSAKEADGTIQYELVDV